MHVSWIIPAYREAQRIEKTIREVSAYLESKRFADGYEIIVVDSSSPDKTPDIVRGLTDSVRNMKLLSVENRGKGWAVREGMLAATGAIRIFSDADNSTAPNYFDAMEPLLAAGNAVVISTRDPKDAPGASRGTTDPLYRRILSRMGNLVIQIFGVWGINDTQNGFKAFSAEAAAAIFGRIRMYGFSFDIEVLALARRLGYHIAIIPIQWRFDPDSKVTLGAYLQVFMDVFKIRLNFILGRYGI